MKGRKYPPQSWSGCRGWKHKKIDESLILCWGSLPILYRFERSGPYAWQFTLPSI